MYNVYMCGLYLLFFWKLTCNPNREFKDRINFCYPLKEAYRYVKTKKSTMFQENTIQKLDFKDSVFLNHLPLYWIYK